MTTQELERINMLAAKAREQGALTEQEKEEQTLLRQKYIDEMRGSLRAQLDTIDVQNEDGSITSLKKTPVEKAKKAKPAKAAKPTKATKSTKPTTGEHAAKKASKTKQSEA